MELVLTRDLATCRKAAAARIDAAAEAARARYITLGAGQAMTYQAKAAEARAVLDGAASPHPMLEAEAVATGVTVAALAAVVDARYAQWLAKGAAIEAVRMAGKASLVSAGSPAAIAQAADAVISNLGAL